MSQYNAYPDYRDSGVEWLGNVPAHWEVMAIRWLTPVQRGASPRPIDDEKYFDDEQGEYGWVRIEDVSASNGFLEQTKQRLSTLGAELSVKLEPGSLFLSIAGSVGKPCINLVKACIHDGFVYFPLLSVNPMWLFKIFESRSPFVGLGKMGTQLNLNTETVGGIRVSIPPNDEIEAILNWIDLKTERIDGLISKKTRFIELLREKRQAVITHAVTKGLAANVPMNNSGVEWLGDMPAHWKVTRLKFIANVQTGVAKGKDVIGRNTVLVPYLRVANVQDGYLALDDVTKIEMPLEDIARYRLQYGDVLMNEGGDFNKLGRGHIWKCEIETCIHQNHVFAVRPTKISPDWLNTYTGSSFAQFYFMTRAKQSTNLASISSTNIMELPVVLPPESERLALLEHIANETNRIDTLISTTQLSIELLKERRSALITAAVTGQIDLRGTM